MTTAYSPAYAVLHRRSAGRILLTALGLITLIIVLQAPRPAHAADDEDEAPRVYQVDVIVFRNLDALASSESFPALTTEAPADPKTAEALNELLLRVKPANPGTYYPSRGLGEPGFFLLNPKPLRSPFKVIFGRNDRRKLISEYNRLTASPDYQPVLYATWRQEVTGKTTAEPFDIALAGIPVNVLNGSFTLYRERYMHLVVDLNLPDQTSRGFGNGQPMAYTMNQSRRLKGSNIQYFDHPRFSVITLVTEIVAPKP